MIGIKLVEGTSQVLKLLKPRSIINIDVAVDVTVDEIVDTIFNVIVVDIVIGVTRSIFVVMNRGFVYENA